MNVVPIMLPFDGVRSIVSPVLKFPCWSAISALMVSVSSAVMVAVSGDTMRSTGAPGVTVMFWEPHTKPKHDVMVVVPAVVGVNKPLLPMLPVDDDQVMGGACTMDW